MSVHPNAIRVLIEELKKLPGIGQRAAERLAFYLVRRGGNNAERLADAIRALKEKIQSCSTCFAIAEMDPCGICSSPDRDKRIICVVEDPQDLYSIDRTGEYKGIYHVLMGAITPLEGIGPEMLRIAELLDRVEKDPPKEVILATNPNMEGEATAVYIAKKLKAKKIKVTRIARGIPIGGNLEYADEKTLMKSIQGRMEM